MPRKTIYSVVSKFVTDSLALSFSRSARDNCHKSCRIWSSCYASRIERVYPSLESKLAENYQRGAVWVLRKALADFPLGKSLRWARLSVDGSLPPRSKFKSARQWRIFVKLLRQLVKQAQQSGAKWHVPVETPGKARTYRAALAGLGVVVRRTSQARSVRELIATAHDSCSWIVTAIPFHGGAVTKKQKQANVDLAFEVAGDLRDAGKTAGVCPAIWSDSKCGQCTMCADDRVDVVLYPFHP